MPFHSIRPPRPGTLDHAAHRIYRILEREERAKRRPRKGTKDGEGGTFTQAQSRAATQPDGSSAASVPRDLSGIEEQRAEQREMRRRRKDQAQAPAEPALEPVTDYGVGERLGDLLSGVEKAYLKWAPYLPPW